MPRILPWKRRERNATEISTSARSSPVRHVKREDAGQLHDGAASVRSSSVGNTGRKPVRRPHRSTSTSPPPEPPEETSMIEGIDGDDRYRMVEDEFLATAQQFTAHLHAAEYKRLKAASELENAQMIKNISRPVVGRMTDPVKMKRERKILADKQRLATRKLRKGVASGDESAETDDDANDSWQQKSLYGLMESPGKRARRPDGLPSATPATRAAAGYRRQASEIVSPSQPKLGASLDVTHVDTHESEDDLEVPKSYSVTRRIPQPALTSSRIAELRTGEVKKSLDDFPKITKDSPKYQHESSENTAVSEDEDMDVVARLKRRREERRQSRGQRKSTSGSSKVKSDLNDILPDFL
ncbi:hypothetical protein GGR51DRAFT_258006 [Nemania sp. FL0031]|nr:hypothetical protein GGR51DRAFT_258006 [Nemania sp. FL0031]